MPLDILSLLHSYTALKQHQQHYIVKGKQGFHPRARSGLKMCSYNDEARHKAELMWSNFFWKQRKKEEDLHFFQLSKYCLQPEFTFSLEGGKRLSHPKWKCIFIIGNSFYPWSLALEIRFDNAMSTRSNVMYGAEGDEKPLLTTFKKVLTSFVLQLSLAENLLLFNLERRRVVSLGIPIG